MNRTSQQGGSDVSGSAATEARSRSTWPREPATQRAQSVWVENAKAIGIVLVVYGHAARGADRSGLFATDFPFRIVDSMVYSFHMPLFFFLSGLFFYGSLLKRGALGLVANKIDTLIYPYILWSILQGVVEVLLSKWTNGHATIDGIAQLLWAPRAQLWFLYALFLLFLVGIVTFGRARKSYWASIAVAASLAFLLQNHDAGLAQLRYVLGYFCFFSLGVLFSEYQDTVRRYRWQMLLPALAAFVCGQYVFHLRLGLTYTSFGPASLILALISIAAVVLACMCIEDLRISTVSTVLTIVGSSSMAIYLAHIVFASGTRIALQHGLPVASAFWLVSLGTFLGVVLPILIFRWTQETKLRFLFAVPAELSVEARYNEWLLRKAVPY